MKYLKLFESFDKSDIESVCSDFLLTLKDKELGFDFNFEWLSGIVSYFNVDDKTSFDKSKENILKISITKLGKFTWEDIKDDLSDMIMYLESEDMISLKEKTFWGGPKDEYYIGDYFSKLSIYKPSCFRFGDWYRCDLFFG
jgi:hypothetical protein